MIISYARKPQAFKPGDEWHPFEAKPGGTWRSGANSDIRPGVYPNTIKLGSKGVVPVAILTADEFDASTVDPGTVTFADASPIQRKTVMLDVDSDDDIDMLLYFNTLELNLNKESTEATLTGATADGIGIVGTDSVYIVSKGKK